MSKGHGHGHGAELIGVGGLFSGEDGVFFDERGESLFADFGFGPVFGGADDEGGERAVANAVGNTEN